MVNDEMASCLNTSSHQNGYRFDQMMKYEDSLVFDAREKEFHAKNCPLYDKTKQDGQLGQSKAAKDKMNLLQNGKVKCCQPQLKDVCLPGTSW